MTTLINTSIENLQRSQDGKICCCCSNLVGRRESVVQFLSKSSPVLSLWLGSHLARRRWRNHKRIIPLVYKSGLSTASYSDMTRTSLLLVVDRWSHHHLLLPVLGLVVLPSILVVVVVVAEDLPSLVPATVRPGDYYVFRQVGGSFAFGERYYLRSCLKWQIGQATSLYLCVARGMRGLKIGQIDGADVLCSHHTYDEAHSKQGLPTVSFGGLVRHGCGLTIS